MMNRPLIYMIPLFLSALITAVLFVLSWRRRAPGARPFSFLMLAFTQWTVANALSLLSSSLQGALFWDRMKYLGIEATPIACLVFAGRYSGSSKWLTTRVIAWLSVFPAIVVALVWTDSWHHWIYTGYRLLPGIPTAVLDVTYGPVFWLDMAFAYAVLLIGVALLLEASLRAPQLYRRQFISIFIALLFPLTASIVDISGYNVLFHYTDLAPLFFPITGLAIFWGITRYRLLEIAPIARSAVVEAMRDGVIVLDAYSRIVDVNPAAQRMIGQAATDLIGAGMADAWPACAEALAELAGKQDTDREFAAPDARWYSLRASRLSDWRDETIGHLVTLRDISDLKSAESKRAALEDQLRQVQKLESIGILAGGVAHDFNNLLTPIVGYAQMTWQEMPPDDPHRWYMERILQAAQGAAAFTKQLTGLNRRSMVIRQVVNLGRIIREFLPVLRSFVGERIGLNVQIDPAAGNVNADPGQIQQVLMNLVLNARDAMPGGGEVRIELASAKPDKEAIWRCPALGSGPCVSLTVRDQGTGMDAATLEHIFEPFFTTKPRGKGTGLGLVVVFGIVKEQQGHVSVDSTPGRGTAVQITLPCVDQPESARESTQQMPAVCHPGTILLAEDEESVRSLLRDVLKSQGYDLLVASDGEEALALARQTSGPISLLLTDVIMPHTNGDGLYRQLVALRPGLKVVFMSGYPDDVISRQDIDNQTARFLAKPFTIPQLLQTIEAILSAASD